MDRHALNDLRIDAIETFSAAASLKSFLSCQTVAIGRFVSADEVDLRFGDRHRGESVTIRLVGGRWWNGCLPVIFNSKFRYLIW